MDIQQVRSDFPILQRQVNGHPLIYLDNAATSQKPQSVIDVIVNYYQHHNANVHRGIHTLGDESTQAYQDARHTIARFIGAKDDSELIFTRNTTEAINMAAFSWGFKHLAEGDEILVTELEHHSNLVTWQRLAQQTGAKLLYLPISDNGDLVIEYLESLVGERTKLLALTHVSNVLGTIVDVKHLVKKLEKQGSKAKILIDAAQSIPHMPVNVVELDVDFVAFSGHKMLGPMGIGGLWVRREVLEDMDPFLVGGGMIDQVTKESSTWASLPDKFDAGTPNVADAVGLAAAVQYLKQVGMTDIHQHEQELTRYGLEKFQELEDNHIIKLYGPKEPDHRTAIITFNVTGTHAHDTAQVLDRQFGIAIRSGHHCNQILVDKLGVPATCRASFYLYNTKEEIDQLIKGIQTVYQMFNK